MSISPTTVSNEILSILLNNLPIGGIEISNVQLPNQEDADDVPTTDDAPWARAAILFNDGNQYSLGPIGRRKYERRGILSIQTFVTRGDATQSQLDICDEILTLYEQSTVDCLYFYNGRVETNGADSKWFQQSVVLEFKYIQQH